MDETTARDVGSGTDKPASNRGIQGWFAELRRRHIFKVTIAYLVLAWLLLQVAAVLEASLKLPDWIDTATFVFLVVGFPVAIILTWAVNLSPDRSADSESERTATKEQSAAVIEPQVHLEAASRIAASGKPSIAVLPFDNLSGDPEQEYFSDGITGDLITALSRIRRFQVVARSSTFSYKGRSLDVRQVAREMDARYVIEGSVRKAGDTIRLSVQLIDGDSGKQIWAETYDRELKDIFVLQDELSISIIGAIEPAMGKSERERAMRRPPETLDAWEAYQQGMSFLSKRTEEDLAAAKKLFQRAIAIDPQFALAHAGLSRTYFWHILLGTTAENREEAEKAAKMAVELDPDEAETHTALGMVCYTNRDFERVISEAEAAISLNPSFASAYYWLGAGLIQSGRAEEALPHLLTAIRLSPKDTEIGNFHARLATAHLYLRRHEESVKWARKALDDLLAFRPGITVSFVRDQIPMRFQDYLNHLLDGLRKAGLPE